MLFCKQVGGRMSKKRDYFFAYVFFLKSKRKGNRILIDTENTLARLSRLYNGCAVMFRYGFRKSFVAVRRVIAT